MKLSSNEFKNYLYDPETTMNVIEGMGKRPYLPGKLHAHDINSHKKSNEALHHSLKDLLMFDESFWYCVNRDRLRIGISNHVSNKLGELILIELPEVGEKLSQGCLFGLIFSLRTTVELKMPMNGKIIAINKKLEQTPELIQTDAFDQGWMIDIQTDYT